MSALVLFLVGPALGHVSRTAQVVNALRVARPGLRLAVLSLAPIPWLDEFFAPPVAVASLPARQPLDRASFAENIERAIATLRPDVICHDHNAMAIVGTRLPAGVPRAFLTNWFLTRAAGLVTHQVKAFCDQGAELNAFRRGKGLADLADRDRKFNRGGWSIGPGPLPREHR
jgi:hypothetical protein